jgi:hypothetical protein
MGRPVLSLLAGLAVLAAASLLCYQVTAPPGLAASDPPGVAKAGALSLTHFAVPDFAPEREAVIVPGAQGDRVVVERDGGRVARSGADGRTRWATTLVGYVGSVRWPHVVADADRAHVTHNGGVTALDVRSGKVIWHSRGPGDRLLLSGDLLVAADCSVGVDGKRDGR